MRGGILGALNKKTCAEGGGEKGPQGKKKTNKGKTTRSGPWRSFSRKIKL